MQMITINLDRIRHLQKLFRMDDDALMDRINGVVGSENKVLKKRIPKEKVFTDPLSKNILKRIDNIFEKGLSFYTDPSPPPRHKSSSIFFRKEKFNVKLNLSDKKKVCEMEGRIHSLGALCALSDFPPIPRKFKKYSVQDNPYDVMKEVSDLYPTNKITGDRAFLEALIECFAGQNILVVEFIEHHNKKDKTSLEGVFISPHYIVLKRNQRALKREIFTLAHELGHYLLSEEEIDEIRFENESEKLSDTERWCNDFAFAFLSKGEKIAFVPESIDDVELQKFSNRSHLSKSAILTHLALRPDISFSWENWKQLHQDLNEEAEKDEDQRRKKNGTSTSNFYAQPKLIYSPLEKDIYASAYFEGVVEEYEALKHFNAEDIDKLFV